MSEPWKDFEQAPMTAQSAAPWEDFQSPPAAPAAAPAAQPFHANPAIFEGVGNGLETAEDNIASWAEHGLSRIGIPMDKINRALGQEDADAIKARHLQARQADAARGQKSSMIGESIGNAVASAPAMVATSNPLILGGVSGALGSDAKDAEGLAFDTGLGALLGKAGDVVLGGAGRFIKDAVPTAAQQLLRSAGVDLTPGQLRGGAAKAAEDLAMSRPKVGQQIYEDRAKGLDQFVRGAVNRALLPLGDRVDASVVTGHDMVADMLGKIGSTYDAVMPKLSLQADKTFLANARPVVQQVANLPAETQKTFYDFITPKLTFSGPNNLMAGKPLAVALRDIKKRGADLVRSSVQGERDLGVAYQDMAAAIHDTLQRQNPEFGPVLKAANKAYRGAMVVVNAASRADEGVFNTGQLKQAVRAADRTKGKTATASGKAFMQDYSSAGRASLPSSIPDSGTAGRSMAGKLIPTLRGYADRAGYDTNKAVTGFLADHPELSRRVGGLLSGLSPPSSVFLGGLRPDPNAQ